MATDPEDSFGGYAPDPPTAGSEGTKKELDADSLTIATEKYGISKPRRIIVRGIVANDKGPDNQRE